MVTGIDLHDLSETLGRFLFGYFLMKIGVFESIESKLAIFRKTLVVSLPPTLLYIAFQGPLSGFWEFDPHLASVGATLGVLSMSCFYASGIVLLFICFSSNRIFVWLQSLGKMTLTNYLLTSALLIVLLYGLGFGWLGEVSIRSICLVAVAAIAVETTFSCR